MINVVKIIDREINTIIIVLFLWLLYFLNMFILILIYKPETLWLLLWDDVVVLFVKCLIGSIGKMILNPLVIKVEIDFLASYIDFAVS